MQICLLGAARALVAGYRTKAKAASLEDYGKEGIRGPMATPTTS
jgi:hypothetical protein